MKNITIPEWDTYCKVKHLVDNAQQARSELLLQAASTYLAYAEWMRALDKVETARKWLGIWAANIMIKRSKSNKLESLFQEQFTLLETHTDKFKQLYNAIASVDDDSPPWEGITTDYWLKKIKLCYQVYHR